MQKINMAAPFFTQEDRDWIHREVDIILSGSLSMGPNVKDFESEFADRIGVKYAIAMNSCTSALEAALLAKGASGREVIIPAETFIATGMAVHLVGAKPVFAEISESTLCLDLEDVKTRVTSQTAGVILVHMAGLITPDVLALRQFCDENELFLIEDAAHAPGARFGGREAGTFGHIGCFSFFPSKVITSGEGGMLTTDDGQIANYARSFQNRGRDMEAVEEQFVIPGRNVRMSEISALLGRVQLSHLDEFLTKRRQLAKIYISELSKLNELRLIVPDLLENSSFWKFPLLLNPMLNRELITKEMADAGVVVDSAYQPALHLQPVFRNLYSTSNGLLPRTEEILRHHLCLPCHQGMTENDVIYVAKVLKKIINKMIDYRRV